jgi:N-methylhydantoinase B
LYIPKWRLAMLPTDIDPVLVEVMRNELLAASDEMNITMMRTTRSIAARENGDYSAAILDLDGNVIAQSVPFGFAYFVGAMPNLVATFRDRWRPGDVVVTNDPYGGVSHLPDILLATPIFYNGDLFGFAAVVEHHTDIGGRFPGGQGVESQSIYEEGLRFPAIHFHREGVVNDAVRAIIAANVRTPDDVLGDLEAGIAACRRGTGAMLALLGKYGPDVVRRYCDHLLLSSQQKMRTLITSIPNGDYSAEGAIDDGRGTTAKLCVTLRVQGENLVVDYTGTSAQVNKALNMSPDSTLVIAVGVLLGLLGNESDSLMMNSGLMRQFSLVSPKGTVLNPTFPAAVGARAQTFNRLQEVVREALARALPGRVPAAGDGGPSFFIFAPTHNEGQGRSLVTEVYCSGWGARPDRDGIEGVMKLTMSGFRTTPGETTESETSVALDGFGFVPDTGGAGTYRGALSVYRRWRFRAAGRVLLRTCRADSLPPGLAGGKDGTPFKVVHMSADKETILPAHYVLDINVEPGDILLHVLPGAGGYGDPTKRDPDRVLADVLDEKISAGYAQRNYGVVIDIEKSEIDLAATGRLRESMKRTTSDIGKVYT